MIRALKNLRMWCFVKMILMPTVLESTPNWKLWRLNSSSTIKTIPMISPHWNVCELPQYSHTTVFNQFPFRNQQDKILVKCCSGESMGTAQLERLHKQNTIFTSSQQHSVRGCISKSKRSIVTQSAYLQFSTNYMDAHYSAERHNRIEAGILLVRSENGCFEIVAIEMVISWGILNPSPRENTLFVKHRSELPPRMCFTNFLFEWKICAVIWI